jgi:hypothetical protein
MTFRKFFDYGGHSWGWECISCKEIIDQIQEIYPSAKQVWNEKEKLGMGKGI